MRKSRTRATNPQTSQQIHSGPQLRTRIWMQKPSSTPAASMPSRRIVCTTLPATVPNRLPIDFPDDESMRGNEEGRKRGWGGDVPPRFLAFQRRSRCTPGLRRSDAALEDRVLQVRVRPGRQ